MNAAGEKDGVATGYLGVLGASHNRRAYGNIPSRRPPSDRQGGTKGRKGVKRAPNYRPYSWLSKFVGEKS